jgi:hypothetical protein
LSARAAAFGGFLGAALAALVAALRVPAWPAAFVVLLGSSALVLVPLAALLADERARLARKAPAGALAPALVAGLALATPLLARLLSVLKTTTHHRPLGAVTFAVLAAFTVLGCCVLAVRVFSWTRDGSRPVARSARRLFLALAVAGPFFLLLRAAATPVLRTGLFDLSLGLGSAISFQLIQWPSGVLRLAHTLGVIVPLGAVLFGLAAGLIVGTEPASDASFALVAPLVWVLR